MFVKLNIKNNNLNVKATTSFYRQSEKCDYKLEKYANRIFEDKMKIAYCPMCGRKLGE